MIDPPVTSSVDTNVDAQEEAGVFETAADFFSLLSLAIIYMAVIFGLSGGSGDLMTVTRLAAGGSGATVPFDPTFAYVAVLPERSGMLVRLQTPSGEVVLDRLWPVSDQGETEAISWVLSTLSDDQSVAKVVCHLSPDEDRGSVHRAFNRLVGRLRNRYEVSITT
jgi:hypothetical protein